MREKKIERGRKLASLPDAVLNVLLENPRGLDRLLADVAPEPVEVEPDRWDENFEGWRN